MFSADNEDVVPDVIVACALIGKSAALGSTYVCQIFTAELYPTVIRSVLVFTCFISESSKRAASVTSSL